MDHCRHDFWPILPNRPKENSMASSTHKCSLNAAV